MRCLYEVLGIERSADDDAIKKAYRKQALIWHPDKNADRLEEAGQRFKEISNAYEVLSDKQERAWYDSHREHILRSGERHQAGASTTAGGQRPDDEVDLFQFFTSSCYSGHNDGPKGFYTVYRTLFEELAKQERAAADSKESSKAAAAPFEYPAFGSSTSDGPTVSTFYAHWSTFSTSKDFAWADQYNPASAPNRQVRRRMEEENKKGRKAARREFNEAVRDLVAFVKKRDKRVAVFQAEEAARRAAREAEEAERRRLQREERLRAAAEYQEAEWAAAGEDDDDDDATGVAEGGFMETIDEGREPSEEFFCIVCEKRFKSDKQLKNHERSRKHLDQVAELRAVLQEEEA